MALRSIEIILPEKNKDAIEKLLSERKEVLDARVQPITGTWRHPIQGIWYGSFSENQILIKILALAEKSEDLLDLLQERFSKETGFRITVAPVEATLPRIESPSNSKTSTSEEVESKKADDERISREELYADIEATTRLTKVFVVMVALSSIVAAIGILKNNVAVIIGAMVIAPLLGPNVALSLATTLGDVSLANRAIKTNFVGLFIAICVSVAIGFFSLVDPTIPELLSRTKVGLDEVVLALVSGCAGALAFTSGISASLIGVAVAVALLPPLVTFGLLLGSGHFYLAIGAMLLFLVNFVSINLAGVATFLAQGIFPKTWLEAKKARRAIIISMFIWILLLAILISAILFSRQL
jgi:uncharacterized hydrophobic protein (TIGR00341 family)